METGGPKTEEVIFLLLKNRGLSLGTVESATGGLVSHRLTNVAGISELYKGSIVAYANEIKVRVVGVASASIESQGAVSAEVAEEMAAGGRQALDVDVCISDTGIAGPGGATPDKPVGLFYLGLAHGRMVVHRRLDLKGDREQNKAAAAESLLCWLREYLEGLESE
jgi:nicotinamide-nucleotide amidase